MQNTPNNYSTTSNPWNFATDLSLLLRRGQNLIFLDLALTAYSLCIIFSSLSATLSFSRPVYSLYPSSTDILATNEFEKAIESESRK